MNPILLLIALLAVPLSSARAQDLDRDKLDRFFRSLEHRNQAMGSMVISKNGKTIYKNAIGFRSIDQSGGIPSDSTTHYRVWSVTKIYTAVMIMQLVEEGKLSLDTTLSGFFPGIPNAKLITIQDMLRHRSGIHDFTQNLTGEAWDTHLDEPFTPAFMVNHIGQYLPDFQPDEKFGYSNSNYLLLGYIIELLDGRLYKESLQDRISSRIGLNSTYFGVGALDEVDNKAFSYRYTGDWVAVDEGPFSGLVPAGAGGIVSTPADMATFIESLFSGTLISKNSLKLMLPSQDFHGMGLMHLPFREKAGFGHTGGYLATESSLVYFPEDSLAIAYVTNGIVIRKEDLLELVLKIYHGEPFGVSMNRPVQAFLIFGIGLLLFWGIHTYARSEHILWAGLTSAILFWVGSIIAGFLYGNHDPIKDELTQLDAFYSRSGTFMAGVQLIVAMLMAPFLIELYKSCKRLEVRFLPILSLVFVLVSLLGASLFPFPNVHYALFSNVILLTAVGPLLAVFVWRGARLSKLRGLSAICLLLMVISTGFVFSRATIPEFVHTYWGMIQRLLYAGWTMWLAVLSLYFVGATKDENSRPRMTIR